MVKVDINSEGNIILFKRMNQVIVDSYKRRGTIPVIGEHTKRFEQVYGVKIHLSNWGNWSHMEFPSESAYLAAILKYS